MSREESSMKKVLFVASEAVPFIKTGGLADVVGSLPKALIALGADVRIVIPKYKSIKQDYFLGTEFLGNFNTKLVLWQWLWLRKIKM